MEFTVCSDGFLSTPISGNLPCYETGSLRQNGHRSRCGARVYHRDCRIAIRHRVGIECMGQAGHRASHTALWL